MDGCEKFPAGSRQRQICEGSAGLSVAKVNGLRAMHGIAPISVEKTEDNAAVALSSPAKPVRLKANRSCNSCGKKKQQKTNPKISIISKAVNYVSAIARHAVDDMATTHADDIAFRESKCNGCPNNINSECLLCGCPLSPGLINDGKIRWRSESCPAGLWFKQNETRAPLAEPTRNLIFHIYPKSNADWNWKWHIEQIRKHASLFNGKICIGIVAGDGLESEDAVQKEMSDIPVATWVIKENDKTLSETVTFADLLRCVQTENKNEVTFRGHTKGVTHKKDSIEQKWKELMWETCMDWESVSDALSSHIMAGSMKCHEPLTKKSSDAWFYAGTFFWFRSEVFNRDWFYEEKTRWWPEYWPGHVCQNNEAACLCHDFAKGSKFSYEYWEKEISPDWKDWKEARIRS